ncbi:MAG: M15 family metallopeptidase [Acidimicrobiales bacterium]
MRRVVAGLVAVAGLAACAGGEQEAPAVLAGRSSTTTTTTAPAASSSSTTATVPAAVTAAPATTAVPTPKAPAASVARPERTAPATAAPATTAAPRPAPAASAGLPTVMEPFESSVRVIDDAIAARMSASWRPGCPVGLEDLRLVTVSHWGFDGRPQVGELVVHVRSADALVGVFERLFRARFPVERMRLVDEYGADDDRSMAANNTSAFNCRTVAGSTRWSEHAYGSAVDVNPVQNPYVTRSGVSPPAGAAHTARSASTPGLITRDGPVVAAFAAIGWGWGGSWSSGKDYQHFSASGR